MFIDIALRQKSMMAHKKGSKDKINSNQSKRIILIFLCGVITILTVLNTENLTQNTIFMSRVGQHFAFTNEIFSCYDT